jgi:release factor glutamine methyltransferase
MTTIQEALERGVRLLGFPTVQGARLDAQVLLCHVLGIARATLYAYPEREITPVQAQDFFCLVERRAKHEPIAYLTGHKEFYGRDFLVDRRVLIPRPETEILVEEALLWIKRMLDGERTPVVADIGTGSGAIPVTIALEESRLPYLYACDVSASALEVARLNALRLQAQPRVRFLLGDLLEPLPEPVDILLANLPYIGTDEQKDLAADVQQYEPHLALFSGPQGLNLLQRFCKDVQTSGILKSDGVMLLEIGYQQQEVLIRLFGELWPEATVTTKRDFAGYDRLLRVQL